MERIGKITYLRDSGGGMGVGYLLEEGENGFVYGFGFGVLEEYGGESVAELKTRGVCVGTVVRFTRSHLTVLSVKPVIFRPW